MKLLTHNMLTSHVKGVKNGYPLRILVILVHAAQQTVQFNCVCVCSSSVQCAHLSTCLQAKQVVVKAVDFNADFIARMLLKLDWSVLKTTAESVRMCTQPNPYLLASASVSCSQTLAGYVRLEYDLTAYFL